MYNEEFKLRFIDECLYYSSLQCNYAKRQFEVFSEMETSIGKDLYDFNINEIMLAYKLRCFSSVDTLNVLNAILSKYTKFALAENRVKDGQNHYDEIDFDMLMKCINVGLMKMRILSRENIDTLLDQMIEPYEKFLILSLFEGVCGNYFCNVVNCTAQDFDAANGKMRLANGEWVSVSNRLISIALQSAATYEYETYRRVSNGEYVKDREIYAVRKFKADDARVLKSKYNVIVEDNPDALVFRTKNKLYIIRERYGIELSMTSIEESGRIDMINRLMREDGTDDWRETYRRHVDEIGSRYGYISSETKYDAKYGDFLGR